MTSKTIFLPPNFFFYPAAKDSHPGSIRLGSLISNIKDPGHSIGTLPPLDMADYSMPISSLEGTSMGHTDNSSSSFSANLLVKAVELVGAKLNINTKNSRNLLAAMDEIKTEAIDPDDDYVKKSIEQPKVQSWLKATWPRHRIFMVCGILIARPAADSKVDISTSSLSNLSAAMQVDGAVAQSPVGGSAGTDMGYAKEFGLGFVPKTPFIYGFTLRECFLKRGLGSSKPHTKGAKMHHSGAAAQNESVESEEPTFDSDVSKVDLDFDSLGDFEDEVEQPSSVNISTSNASYSLLLLKSK